MPREEQLIRASRAAELGLIDMLLPEEAADPLRFAAALKALPDRNPPSKSAKGMTLEGLANISQIVGEWLGRRDREHLTVVKG
jgi:predicted glycosyltransferase